MKFNTKKTITAGNIMTQLQGRYAQFFQTSHLHKPARGNLLVIMFTVGLLIQPEQH
jgi:hypothetical protein